MLGGAFGWLSAWVLMFGSPRVAAPANMLADGAVVPALGSAGAPERPERLERLERLERWIRATLGVHAQTNWTARAYAGYAGTRVLVLEESWAGIPIAGARLALRVRADGRLRQVIGESLHPGMRLPAKAPGATPDPGLRWWPTESGLELARLELSPLEWVDQAPHQTRRLVHVESGRVLAEDSALDHATLEISGWRENPVSTPDPEAYFVDVIEADPLVLEHADARVLQCVWDNGSCSRELFPTAPAPDAFADPPPGTDDTDAHTDWHDPWVGPQVLQYASRVIARYESWGWDPAAVWNIVDCSWQQVPPEQCKLEIWVNVLANGEDGAEPYNGAYHTFGKGVFLGQGTRGDSGFDMQLVAHEIMHHVQRGYGDPEPSEFVDDGGFLRHDIGAINEGTSDLFARFAGESDELYQYFRNFMGLYQGPYRRDVSVPFRCPDNITGEVHMEGRIWASAWHDVHLDLQAAGLADADTVPALFFGVVPALRQLALKNPTQFANASAIVLDEIELSLGLDARDLAEEIVRARGLIDCGYVIDLHDEPSVTGDGDPESPGDARFLAFRPRSTAEDPQWWDERPYAPAVQHGVELAEDETRVVLRFVPDVWHRTHLADEPFDGEGLVFAALIKRGEDPIAFRRDPETDEVTNDAERRALSEPDPDREPQWRRIVIEELEPGQPYRIALVALSPLDGGVRPVMQTMEWEIEARDDASTGCGCAAGGAGEDAPSWLALGWLVVRARPRRRGGQPRR